MADTLTILHIFASFEVGGQQRRFAELARSLPGYTHIIAAMDNRHEAAALLSGVDHEIVPLEIAKGKALDAGNIKRLRRLIRDSRADLLCTYNWGSMEAVIANRLGLGGRLLPHLHFEDGFGPQETPERQLPRRVLMRRAALSASDVVVPSMTLARLSEEKWRIRRVHLLPNGVDSERFFPAEARTEGPLTVGTVGVLRPEKNFARLIEAFAAAALPDGTRLVIGGSGPEMERLETLAIHHDIAEQVSFPGHIEDPAPLYRTFDLFAMSSDTEQMPLSLLEAMATGLPVAATDVGDIAHIVAEENRDFVTPAGDTQALSQAIASLAGDPALRERLGQANRERAVGTYSRAMMLENYDRLFREVAGR